MKEQKIANELNGSTLLAPTIRNSKLMRKMGVSTVYVEKRKT